MRKKIIKIKHCVKKMVEEEKKYKIEIVKSEYTYENEKKC